jgi:hypothetical protein
VSALATGFDNAGEQGEGAQPGVAARAHHDAARDDPMAQGALGLVVGERPLGMLQHPKDGLLVVPELHGQGARLGVMVP